MKKTLGYIATLKKIDLGYQIAAFITMIFCIVNLGPFALYIMGAAQLISCLYWRLYPGLPAPRSRRIITPVFFIVGAIIVASALTIPLTHDPLDGAFGVVIIALLYTGPALGVWYFIVTIREIFWYKRAALPAYQ